MKVEDIVMVVNDEQVLCIDVIMQEDVDGVPQTYSMTWAGVAHDVPLSIMRTDIRHINSSHYDELKIVSEM